MRLALASEGQAVYLAGEVYSCGRLSARRATKWTVSRVVHSLFKDYHMRKIILAAAVAGAALSLAACSKTEEAATSAESVASDAGSADSAVSADSAATEAASAASSN